MTIKKIMGLFVGIVLSVFFTLAVVRADSRTVEINSPSKTVGSFIQAIQAKNVDKAFVLDFYQQSLSQGKFKDEIRDIKNSYGKTFEGNPSRCPSTYDAVPCDTIGKCSLVSDVRLFVPKTSKYDVAEVVYSDQKKNDARILIKINYSHEHHLVYVDDLKAVQVYEGGITPIPPIFSGYGILTSDNALLAATECGKGNSFPFKFVRKEISSAMIEFQVIKIHNVWLVKDIKVDEKRLTFY